MEAFAPSFALLLVGRTLVGFVSAWVRFFTFSNLGFISLDSG